MNDGDLDSAPAAVNITITALNDQPVADSLNVTTSEDTATSITLTGADADNDTLTFQVLSGPAHGSINGTPPELVNGGPPP